MTKNQEKEKEKKDTRTNGIIRGKTIRTLINTFSSI